MKATIKNTKEFYELLKKDFETVEDRQVKHVVAYKKKDTGEEIFIQNTVTLHFPDSLLSYFEDLLA